MKLRLVIAVTCGIAVAAPAYALQQEPPQSAAIQTTGTTGSTFAWSPNDAEIAEGGTVTFSNPSPYVPHSVTFTNGPATPQCSGLPDDSVGASQWTGSCRFPAAGTYTFVCSQHPLRMTGTIRVTAPAPAPAATASPTATPQSGSSPSPGPGAGASPGGQPPQSKLAVTLAASQKGSRVRGSVAVAQAGSRLVVEVWAPRRSLSSSKSSKLVRIGRMTRAAVPKGQVSFAVGTDAKARSALRRHHRLSVTVRIALTPPGGHELVRSVKSTLRAG